MREYATLHPNMFNHETAFSIQDGDTALHYASKENASATVELLIQKSAEVNNLDNDGWTPLTWAARSNSIDAAVLLLGSGGDITQVDKVYILYIVHLKNF